MHTDLHDHHPHDHGLAADLERLIQQTAQRRHALRWLVAGGAASLGTLGLGSLAGCGGGGDSGSSTAAATGTTSTTTGTTSTGVGTTTTTTTTTTSTASSCSVIPEETAGPYPGDGSNNGGSGGIANALLLSGIVRSDIRNSIGSATGTASGVPLTLTLKLVNTNGSCASLAGYAIYLWHCDALGRYSMYSSGITAENYLRGVQVTDANGSVAFTTIFPGCYSGRVPHIHFEVYRSSTTASSWTNKLKTSQLAFPVATSQAVYAASGYSGSAANLAAISFASDNVFSDGVTTQLATVSGSNSAGYAASLQVGISV